MKCTALVLSILFVAGNAFDQNVDWLKSPDVYQFEANDIDGNKVSLSKYEGHPLIIVNTASLCGLTDTNYKELQELYGKYESKGLRISAFPSGDFANQEYGTSQEIKDFVSGYNITFDMYEKVHVNGDEAHPLWKYLQTRQREHKGNEIKWNFTKFMVDGKGKVVARFTPTTSPKHMEDTVLLYL